MPARARARLIVSLAAFALCAELAGLAAYYIDTGAFFYTHRKTYPAVLPTPGDRLVLAETTHPYFGFTHRPGTPFGIPAALRPVPPPPAQSTNNFGFASPVDYPFPKRTPRQFIIGLFGGSVGTWFCQLGAPRLVQRLQEFAYFREREVVPLCFSHEGYKQPQQALLVSYFLTVRQPFDAVINIDGFNEVALGSLNNDHGLDISMPSVQHLNAVISTVNQSALTPEKLQTLAAIFRDRERLIELDARITHNVSAAVHAGLEVYRRRVNGRYVRSLGRFSNLPANPPDNAFIQITRATHPTSGDMLYTEIAALWAESSLVMHETLATRNVPYFHFLQPNQYDSRREFSARERAVALNDASPYKIRVEKGYPALRRAAEDLRRRGVRFSDATGALDAEQSPVYLDDCCHYTLAGNYALADFIARWIVDSPGPWHR